MLLDFTVIAIINMHKMFLCHNFIALLDSVTHFKSFTGLHIKTAASQTGTEARSNYSHRIMCHMIN